MAAEGAQAVLRCGNSEEFLEEIFTSKVSLHPD